MVDDHPTVLVDLPPILEANGNFRVIGVSSIDAALVFLGNNSVDVVVADWHMGDKRGGPDGGNLLDLVERWHRGVGRILFSVDPLGKECARSSGHYWHDKDDDISELVELIQKVAYRG